MNKIDRVDYIATNNQGKALHFLKSKGSPKPKDTKQIGDFLDMYIAKKGDDGLAEVIEKTHPDYHLCVEVYKKLNPPVVLSEDKDEKQNACGCGLIAAAALAADGKAGFVNPAETKKLSDKTLNTIIISGSAVLAVALIAIIIKNSK